MILERIASNKQKLLWTFFHILLGIMCTITSSILIIWFYIVLLTNYQKVILNLKQGKPFYFIILFSYLTSFEMLGRMAKAYPFLPMELGKYFLILFGLIGISITQKFNIKILMITILISISLFFDYSNQRTFFDIINNYFGVLALSMVLMFLLTLNRNELMNFKIDLVLKFIFLAIVPALVYTFIKTPDIEDIEFKLSANFETSGGASTNQVSTVLGVGMVFCFYSWLKYLNFTGNRIFDLIMGLAFLAQGLLTFSRGGILVGFIAIILLVALINEINFKSILFSTLAICLLLFTFFFIDNLTEGKLFLRYKGETNGTYNFGAEKDLKKFTSGRSMIFEEDMKLWNNHPIFGVGVGSSRHIRGGSDEKISSHVELSRLLAEHGIWGLIYFFVILLLGFKLFKIVISDKSKVIYFILFIIGFLTTFHAGMRTFVTPLLIGLSVIGLKALKKKNAVIINRGN